MSYNSKVTLSRSEESALDRMVTAAAHVLPAQGPIGVFIHHNTLHAFEDLPFEDAVMAAGDRYGCRPFLAEEEYRRYLATGRITRRDVAAIIGDDLGEGASQLVGAMVARGELRRRVATHGVKDLTGPTLAWMLSETPALTRYRDDLPVDAREIAQAASQVFGGADGEAAELGALWEACKRAVERLAQPSAPAPPRSIRHRELVLAEYDLDIDLLIHPTLIRFTSAYLDQGMAIRPLPGRELGMHGCFVQLYQSTVSRICARWATTLPKLVRHDIQAGHDGLASLAHSLSALGVSEQEWQEFIVATLLALRGWGGMVRQVEERPDRVPAREVPARLVDFLAVRLLLERAALDFVRSAVLGQAGSVTELRARAGAEGARPGVGTLEERTWPLFQLAQLCGFSSHAVGQFKDEQVAELLAELTEFSSVQRRRVLHQAYERHLRNRFFDSLVHQPVPGASPRPDFQVVFCLDEREESFRRHLEEVEPGVETLGAAGFFGVAMYYRGVSDAHPRPLCPVAIQPAHFVREIEAGGAAHRGPWRKWRRRGAGWLGQTVHEGTRTMFLGALLAPIMGAFSVLPLVLRVIWPWLGHRSASFWWSATPAAHTRLLLEPEMDSARSARHSGFSEDEMARIVQEQLENMGIARRLSELVIMVGHGSVSLNNPHESAHDCGACGGGRGGPNARAFAQMANHPGVRAGLAVRGLALPAGTWFVGAEHNTCADGVLFYDEDALPATHRPLFDRARAAFQAARLRNAHERCRRFESVPPWYPAVATLRHVEARAADLAQPRPEYGHATNAYCVVGRRQRTRDLFLDRRAFLVSYDAGQDLEGSILARLLASVVPVVAGISLEYYFSFVDPAGYGSGTKLPHNITGLLGVMDGAQSDLRTGLPWQMVEIHEPVRLVIVVECEHAALLQAIEDQPAVQRLVKNAWIVLASLHPECARLQRIGDEHPYLPERPPLLVTGSSSAWYRGRRGHLPLVAFRSAHPTGLPA